MVRLITTNQTTNDVTLYNSVLKSIDVQDAAVLLQYLKNFSEELKCVAQTTRDYGEREKLQREINMLTADGMFEKIKSFKIFIDEITHKISTTDDTIYRANSESRKAKVCLLANTRQKIIQDINDKADKRKILSENITAITKNLRKHSTKRKNSLLRDYQIQKETVSVGY